MLPDGTLVDGELAILDKNGKPSFRLIQNYQSSKGTLVYFLFDLLIFRGMSVMGRPLDERKAYRLGAVGNRSQASHLTISLRGRYGDRLRMDIQT
jgi:ATP-dependent DNA ligase